MLGRGAVLDDYERQSLNHAMNYIRWVDTRFIDDPDTFRQFLEILASHRSIANSVSSYSFTLPHANVPMRQH
jgi:histone deacetylase complex regulatory component SIN3